MATVRPKVYMLHGIPPDGEGIRLLKEECDVTIYDGMDDDTTVRRDQFLRDIRGMDAIHLTPHVEIDAEVLDAAGPQLKVIGTQSVGLDHIDLAECRKRNVKVGNTPGVHTDAVAELTVGLMLATARRYKEGTHSVSVGKWDSLSANSLYLCGKDIRNSVVGIVGLGRIGLAVAKRLQAFSVAKFLYCGRTPKDHANVVGADFVSFNKLLEDSDFVIACCSLNESNKLLFDADAFKQMKSSAIFINVSRGALVDQDALYNALASGRLLAAGLDVTTPEPLPTDHPLLTLNNCTVLPHLGSASVVARNAMADLTVRNILAGLRGEPLVTPVPE